MDMESTTAASLAPGFRFHPTDEELVWYYLRWKICGKPFRFDAISEIDIYKAEPWDLPGKSRLKSRDLEWYFFSILDKKYGNGSRTNRATDRGYWKTTGKDRRVYHKSQIVGMKKTLVYHSGRAPRGERTNWVMHEYRMVDEELEKAGIVQNAFVLCRIFRKSGPGPKNGEQYGAPFLEEEWEADELVMVPREESTEEVPVSDDACPDAYLDENDLDQILGTGIPLENAPIPLNFCYGDNSNSFEESTGFIAGDQELLVGLGENNPVGEQSNDQKFFDLPVQFDMDAKLVKHEYIGEPSNNANSVDVDYLRDGPFLDANDNPPFDDGEFLETNDLKNPVEADSLGFDMLEEYLSFFDTTDDNLQYMAFDSSKVMGGEDLVSDTLSSLSDKHVVEGTQLVASQKLLEGHNNNVASSSKQDQTQFGSDIQYPFIKHATSRMLGSIPAPPAFASEFPTKDAAHHLNPASQASSSLHVTAGVIQIRNLTWIGSGVDWSFSKHGHVNIILSFGLSRGDDNSAYSQPMPSILASKANAAISRGWFIFMFIWVLVLCMSYKIGTYICAR